MALLHATRRASRHVPPPSSRFRLSRSLLPCLVIGAVLMGALWVHVFNAVMQSVDRPSRRSGADELNPFEEGQGAGTGGSISSSGGRFTPPRASDTAADDDDDDGIDDMDLYLTAGTMGGIGQNNNDGGVIVDDDVPNGSVWPLGRASQGGALADPSTPSGGSPPTTTAAGLQTGPGGTLQGEAADAKGGVALGVRSTGGSSGQGGSGGGIQSQVVPPQLGAAGAGSLLPEGSSNAAGGVAVDPMSTAGLQAQEGFGARDASILPASGDRMVTNGGGARTAAGGSNGTGNGNGTGQGNGTARADDPPETFFSHVVPHSFPRGHESLPPVLDPRHRNPCWYSPGAGRGSGSIRDGSADLACLPYVIILGVHKAGTSDLYRKLSRHPQAFAPPDHVAKGGPYFWQGGGGRDPSLAVWEHYKKEFRPGVKRLLKRGMMSAEDFAVARPVSADAVAPMVHYASAAPADSAWIAGMGAGRAGANGSISGIVGAGMNASINTMGNGDDSMADTDASRNASSSFAPVPPGSHATTSTINRTLATGNERASAVPGTPPATPLVTNTILLEKSAGSFVSAGVSLMGDWEHYYRNAPGAPTADPTVMNVTLPEIMSRASPAARLILMLRNPVDRLYSAFWYYGMHPEYTGVDQPSLFERYSNDSAGFHRYAADQIRVFRKCVSLRAKMRARVLFRRQQQQRSRMRHWQASPACISPPPGMPPPANCTKPIAAPAPPGCEMATSHGGGVGEGGYWGSDGRWVHGIPPECVGSGHKGSNRTDDNKDGADSVIPPVNDHLWSDEMSCVRDTLGETAQLTEGLYALFLPFWLAHYSLGGSVHHKLGSGHFVNGVVPPNVVPPGMDEMEAELRRKRAIREAEAAARRAEEEARMAEVMRMNDTLNGTYDSNDTYSMNGTVGEGNGMANIADTVVYDSDGAAAVSSFEGASVGEATYGGPSDTGVAGGGSKASAGINGAATADVAASGAAPQVPGAPPRLWRRRRLAAVGGGGVGQGEGAGGQQQAAGDVMDSGEGEQAPDARGAAASGTGQGMAFPVAGEGSAARSDSYPKANDSLLSSSSSSSLSPPSAAASSLPFDYQDDDELLGAWDEVEDYEEEDENEVDEEQEELYLVAAAKAAAAAQADVTVEPWPYTASRAAFGGPGSLHIVWFEEYVRNPALAVNAVMEFLGLDPPGHNLWWWMLNADAREKSGSSGAMAAQTRAMLSEFYAPYNARLYAMLRAAGSRALDGPGWDMFVRAGEERSLNKRDRLTRQGEKADDDDDDAGGGDDVSKGDAGGGGSSGGICGGGSAGVACTLMGQAQQLVQSIRGLLRSMLFGVTGGAAPANSGALAEVDEFLGQELSNVSGIGGPAGAPSPSPTQAPNTVAGAAAVNRSFLDGLSAEEYGMWLNGTHPCSAQNTLPDLWVDPSVPRNASTARPLLKDSSASPVLASAPHGSSSYSAGNTSDAYSASDRISTRFRQGFNCTGFPGFNGSDYASAPAPPPPPPPPALSPAQAARAAIVVHNANCTRRFSSVQGLFCDDHYCGADFAALVPWPTVLEVLRLGRDPPRPPPPPSLASAPAPAPVPGPATAPGRVPAEAQTPGGALAPGQAPRLVQAPGQAPAPATAPATAPAAASTTTTASAPAPATATATGTTAAAATPSVAGNAVGDASRNRHLLSSLPLAGAGADARDLPTGAGPDGTVVGTSGSARKDGSTDADMLDVGCEEEGEDDAGAGETDAKGSGQVPWSSQGTVLGNGSRADASNNRTVDALSSKDSSLLMSARNTTAGGAGVGPPLRPLGNVTSMPSGVKGEAPTSGGEYGGGARIASANSTSAPSGASGQQAGAKSAQGEGGHEYDVVSLLSLPPVPSSPSHLPRRKLFFLMRHGETIYEEDAREGMALELLRLAGMAPLGYATLPPIPPRLNALGRAQAEVSNRELRRCAPANHSMTDEEGRFHCGGRVACENAARGYQPQRSLHQCRVYMRAVRARERARRAQQLQEQQALMAQNMTQGQALWQNQTEGQGHANQTQGLELLWSLNQTRVQEQVLWLNRTQGEGQAWPQKQTQGQGQVSPQNNAQGQGQGQPGRGEQGKGLSQQQWGQPGSAPQGKDGRSNPQDASVSASASASAEGRRFQAKAKNIQRRKGPSKRRTLQAGQQGGGNSTTPAPPVLTPVELLAMARSAQNDSEVSSEWWESLGWRGAAVVVATAARCTETARIVTQGIPVARPFYLSDLASADNDCTTDGWVTINDECEAQDQTGEAFLRLVFERIPQDVVIVFTRINFVRQLLFAVGELDLKKDQPVSPVLVEYNPDEPWCNYRYRF
eukprot:jgi/Mesvir1/14519/Mv05216-RA.1